MTNSKIYDLIDSLIYKTEVGEAEWDKVSRTDQFKLNLDHGQVYVERFVTNKNNLLYRFSVENVNGDKIATLSGSNQLSQLGNQEKIKELYEKIKTAYYKVDETLEGLIGEVNKGGKIGKKDDLPF